MKNELTEKEIEFCMANPGSVTCIFPYNKLPEETNNTAIVTWEGLDMLYPRKIVKNPWYNDDAGLLAQQTAFRRLFPETYKKWRRGE